MWLFKKTYISNAEWVPAEDRLHVDVTRGSTRAPEPSIQPKRVKYVIEEMMYWRKANAIHRWFVDNVQGGIDDCREYDVSIDQMKALLDTCERVKLSPDLAPVLLPTQAGFFFGSTDFDDWYWQDLNGTIDGARSVIKEMEDIANVNTFGYLIYQSSW